MNTLSAPSFDLLDVAPISLCNEDLVVDDDINFIASRAKSSADGGSLLIAIIAPTLVIYLECTFVALWPFVLSVERRDNRLSTIQTKSLGSIKLEG